jgi:hypothetical protein
MHEACGQACNHRKFHLQHLLAHSPPGRTVIFMKERLTTTYDLRELTELLASAHQTLDEITTQLAIGSAPPVQIMVVRL